MDSKHYYFDYAATSPVDQRVLKAMQPYWHVKYGNPSSIHYYGRQAKKAINVARANIAVEFGVIPCEVMFTSGGTESNNWVINGVAQAKKDTGKHIIVSAIEHKSIIYPAKFLEHQGWKVDYCPVKSSGLLDLEALEKLIKDDTVLVSIIYANNEIGVVQDLAKISKIIKKKNKNAYFHSDASQAINYLDINVEKLGVDFMTFTAGKIYGPKGVGGLIVREGLDIFPLLWGGGQERNFRSGTENVAGIVGLSEALKISRRVYNEEHKRLKILRDRIISRIKKEIPDTVINGDEKKRLPNNINVSFARTEGESLTLYLDEKGICVSTGSACSASDLDPSHVLLALGMKRELAHGSLRITLGRWTTEETVDYLLEVLPGVVERVRQISAIN